MTNFIFSSFMVNMKIQNNYVGNQTSHKIPRFRGSVSPKFVNYVDELRKDCLMTVPERNSNIINNVCNNILNRVQRIMKNCFPDSYILTIDTERFRDGKQDMIIMDNNGGVKEYLPYGINCGPISIKESYSPISKLIMLKNLTYGTNNKGYIFHDGYSKSLMTILYTPYNPEFADLMKWWKDNINLLRAESPRYYQFEDCEKLCDEYLAQVKQD